MSIPALDMLHAYRESGAPMELGPHARSLFVAVLTAWDHLRGKSQGARVSWPLCIAMAEAGFKDPKTLYRARDVLVKAGWLQVMKGRNGTHAPLYLPCTPPCSNPFKGVDDGGERGAHDGDISSSHSPIPIQETGRIALEEGEGELKKLRKAVFIKVNDRTAPKEDWLGILSEHPVERVIEAAKGLNESERWPSKVADALSATAFARMQAAEEQERVPEIDPATAEAIAYTDRHGWEVARDRLSIPIKSEKDWRFALSANPTLAPALMQAVTSDGVVAPRELAHAA